MTTETTTATAQQLVTLCRENRTEEGLETLYHPDAVSVEAMPMPGTDSAETRGVAGIKGKHAWWSSTMEVHSASVDGPYVHGDDRFAVIFEFDATDTSTSKRSQMKEVAIYTADAAGKIVREEFYYNM